MPRAFLTGATGFVGGALLRELLRRGWDVRILARSSSDPRNLEGHSISFERVVGELHDRDCLRHAIAGCDTVFHVAARYSLWNPRPGEVYRDNVDGTRNVLEVAGELGVRRIVHTSTVGVFKLPRDGSPVDESAVASPDELRGHYKRSKRLAEECAMELAGRGLPVVIVNPSTPVGPHDIKPTPTGKMILDFLRRRMPAYTDTGLNVVAVEDVAAGHLLAAEKGQPGRRYILGGENLPLRDLLRHLSSLTGVPAPRLRVPRAWLVPLSTVSTGIAYLTGRPPLVPWEAAQMAQRHMYFDSSRARAELGFAPGSVPGALQRAVEWFVSHGYAGQASRSPLPVRLPS